MKKKIAKFAALVFSCVLAAAIACFLGACNGDTDPSGTGDDGPFETYTYSKATVKVFYKGESLYPDTSSVSDIFDLQFGGSTISVSNSKLIWKIAGTDNALNLTPNNGKNVLSGGYVDFIRSVLDNTDGSGIFGGESKIVNFIMYGVKTESGYNIEEEYYIAVQSTPNQDVNENTAEHYYVTYTFV